MTGSAHDGRSRALTYALLDDTWRWRERLVETFEFQSTHYVRVRSSYQVRISPDLLARHHVKNEGESARLLLPITTRPKRPLVGFDLEVDDRRAHLPLRRGLAELQSGYLDHLLARSSAGREIGGLLPADVLRAICAFTPGVVTGFRSLDRARALAGYLRSLLRLDVSPADVRRWTRRLEPTAAVLSEALEEPRDRLSASENVLLAIPFVTPRPTSVDDVERLVQGYVGAVELASKHADAHQFLVALAEYGRRWEVIADAVVPIGVTCLVKVHEDRPLGLRVGGHCRQRLWCGDAASYHMEARALDPAVTFGSRPSARDLLGNKAAFGLWEGRRITHDAVALYTSDADRPLLVDLTMRLRVSTAVGVPAVVTEVLAVIAIVTTTVIHLGRDRVGTLALLAVPVSLIVAFLVVREQTSLASRLQRARRTRLLAELLVLWTVAIHRLVTG